MRLMRARVTRGTAVVMCVTNRRFGAWLRTAAGRLHPAAGPPPEAPHARRGFRCRLVMASCNPTATRTVDQLREYGRLPRSARVRRQGLEPRTRGLRA